jgi:hypothetical protein
MIDWAKSHHRMYSHMILKVQKLMAPMQTPWLYTAVSDLVAKGFKRND